MENNETNSIEFGKNNILDVLQTRNVSKVFLQKGGSYHQLLNIINEKNIPYVFVDRSYLDRLTDFASHQGIVALTSPIKFLEVDEIIEKNKSIKDPMILMLDEVQDPQNLGAITRVVDAFSINGLIFNKRRNVQITSSVTKVSAGAINHIDVVRANNLRQAIKALKQSGYFIAYLDMNGEYEVNKAKYDMPLVVIIGGENKGVTDSIKKECDFGISIKQSGHVNSLNVASAVSILCYHKEMSRG